MNNPYQPPNDIDQVRSWWSSFLDVVRPGINREARHFAGGHAIIYEGIAFFINPDEGRFAYAASPSTDLSDRRMNLIAAEAIRLFPVFLSEHRSLEKYFVGRKMTVRIIGAYADRQVDFIRERPLEWDYLEAVLGERNGDNLE